MRAPASTDYVRHEVHKLLDGAPAFARLTPEQQRQLRHDMAQVAGFLAKDPEWVQTPARGLDDPVGSLKQQLATNPGFVGAQFKAGAIREGVQQFGELVKKVDFPAFCSGLVQGVFKAVVDASIRQMQAYGELLAATAKTVDEFARDNLTDGQVRDTIRSQNPGTLTIETPSEGPARLRPVGDADTSGIAKAYGISDSLDLTNDDDEQKLVDKARKQEAQSRQQLLATMVLLGINRIVITNGHINAKVLFDVRADDAARRRYKASLHDEELFSHTDTVGASGGLLGDIFGGPSFSSTNTYAHATTVESALDESSEAKAQMKASLSGDVQLAFKSETFPLERMVDVMGMQMQALQDKAQAPPKGGKPAAPAPAPAAAAPAPTGGAK